MGIIGYDRMSLIKRPSIREQSLIEGLFVGTSSFLKASVIAFCMHLISYSKKKNRTLLKGYSMKLRGKLFLCLMLGACASVHAAADSTRKKVRVQDLEVVGTAAAITSKVSKRPGTPPPSRPGTAAPGVRRAHPVITEDKADVSSVPSDKRRALSLADVPEMTRWPSEEQVNVAVAAAQARSRSGSQVSLGASLSGAAADAPELHKKGSAERIAKLQAAVQVLVTSVDGAAAADDSDSEFFSASEFSRSSSSLNDPLNPEAQAQLKALLAVAFQGGFSSDVDDSQEKK